MILKIDQIEEKDQKIREIFPNAQIFKKAPFLVVWTNEGREVASLEMKRDFSLEFKRTDD